MFKVSVNEKEFIVEESPSSKIINGRPFLSDNIEFKKWKFHILRNKRSYAAEIINANYSEKTLIVKINNNEYQLTIKDRYDELLHEMGFDSARSKKGGDIKAPMPGLVLSVMVNPGQQIKTGDTIVVLEAMKMENVLKAQADGVVKKILVIKGDKVEKNQVMVNFE